jgi:hypothetical protein
MNYLIDSYTVYAASVLAANSVLRSLFGAGRWQTNSSLENPANRALTYSFPALHYT